MKTQNQTYAQAQIIVEEESSKDYDSCKNG
jgi:hypothetical protein